MLLLFSFVLFCFVFFLATAYLVSLVSQNTIFKIKLIVTIVLQLKDHDLLFIYNNLLITIHGCSTSTHAFAHTNKSG